MTLVTAILARNEAGPDRYLARVLAHCAPFSDKLLVLDDGSTDDTAKLARQAGALVKTRTEMPAWGAESPARASLWAWAAREAGDGWVLVCDADMLLEGDPRPLCASWDVNAWAWPLVDLWDAETTFRVDGAWAHGPRTPRPWLFRPSALTEPAQWPARGLHCGHAPANFPLVAGVATGLLWKHLAYLTPAHRAAKHAQYLAHADQLTPFELAHAQSILA